MPNSSVTVSWEEEGEWDSKHAFAGQLLASTVSACVCLVAPIATRGLYQIVFHVQGGMNKGPSVGTEDQMPCGIDGRASGNGNG